MNHKTLETKAVITDRGEFTAIAAAYNVDRVKDEIKHGAFAKTIHAWKSQGRDIPLHWDHKGDPHNIIGSVYPHTMEEVGQGLQVGGKVDLEDSELAREAWRHMKANRVALSFGYLATKVKKRADGVQELKEIDLYEISVTPHPVNPDTKFLSLKSSTTELPEAVDDEPSDEPDEAKPRSQDPLKDEIDRLLIDIQLGR